MKRNSCRAIGVKNEGSRIIVEKIRTVTFVMPFTIQSP